MRGRHAEGHDIGITDTGETLVSGNFSSIDHVKALKTVKSFDIGNNQIAAVSQDGSVSCYAVGAGATSNTAAWTGMSQAAVGGSFAAGLSGGKVKVASSDENLVKTAEEWSGIQFIAARNNTLIAVNAKGTVIGAGDNATAAGETDLAGNTRVRGLRVDMGCYEWQDVPATPVITPADGTILSDKVKWQIAVTNDLMTSWGVDLETLRREATISSERLFPAELLRLSDIAGLNFAAPDRTMVLTNIFKVDGASALFYRETEKTLNEQFSEGCYLIPSSIHEFIVIDRRGIDVSEVIEQIRSTNNDRRLIDEEDILSESLYCLDRTGLHRFTYA